MTDKFKGINTLPNGMKMRFDMNAKATFEDVSGGLNFDEEIANLGFLQVQNEFARAEYQEAIKNSEHPEKVPLPKIKGVPYATLRIMAYACLHRFNPDISIAEVGDIMEEYPNALAETISLGRPKQETVEEPEQEETVKAKPARVTAKKK